MHSESQHGRDGRGKASRRADHWANVVCHSWSIPQPPPADACDSILLFAATDTTSHMMSQVLELLAAHTDIQEKVRSEILASRGGQDVAYDQLQLLPYLDAVCKETLRLWVHFSR